VDRLPAAIERELQPVAHGLAIDALLRVVDGVDGASVHLADAVADLHPRLAGGTGVVDARDHESAVVSVAEPSRESRRHLLHRHPRVRLAHTAVLADLAEDALRQIDRNREAETDRSAARREDE